MYIILSFVYTQSKKAQKIREIWASDCGVVSLQIYHNTAAPEAFCREAAMMDAIGMQQCTTDYHHVTSISKSCSV